MPWKNGLGFTTELCTDAIEWTWRVSVADVPAPAAFSLFPGVDRHILCIAGEGMELNINGAVHVVPATGSALTFAGEATVHGTPHGTSVRDLNLMVHRNRWSGWLCELAAGQQVLVQRGDTCVLYAAVGAARCSILNHALRLAAGEAVQASIPTGGVVSARESRVVVAIVRRCQEGP